MRPKSPITMSFRITMWHFGSVAAIHSTPRRTAGFGCDFNRSFTKGVRCRKFEANDCLLSPRSGRSAYKLQAGCRWSKAAGQNMSPPTEGLRRCRSDIFLGSYAKLLNRSMSFESLCPIMSTNSLIVMPPSTFCSLSAPDSSSNRIDS